jgi:hypothetical protein
MAAVVAPRSLLERTAMKWLVTLVAITCLLKPGADFAPELGVNRHPVKGYVESGGWQAYKKPKRRNLLGASREQAGQTFAPASPKPMAPIAVKGIVPVEAQGGVEPHRQQLVPRTRALPTAPGRQVEIHFGKSW